jgi:tetratricopeptide (TPR) repeat protein
MSDDSDARSQGLVYVLVACVVLLLFGGGAVFWWQARQAATLRAEREMVVAEMEAIRAQAEAERVLREKALHAKGQRVREEVERTLKLAVELRQAYRFNEAAALLDSVEPLLDGTDDLKPKVEQAKADLTVLTQLDAIRMRKCVWVTEPGGMGRFDTASAAPAYRAAFRAYGLDLADGDSEDLAGRIKASAVRAELVAALDDWAESEPDPAIRDRILAAVRRADPGPWLDLFRDPAVRGDKAKLEELARSADTAALPPATVAALAGLMQRLGLDPSPLLIAALRQHPGDFGLNLALGQRVVGSSPDQAVAYYRAAVAIQPANTAAWNNLGVTLLQKGDTDEAIASFREAIRLDPANAQAHFNLATAYAQKCPSDEAIAAFRQAIRLDPANAAAHAGLGTVLRNRGENDGALACFREAARLDPKKYESLLASPAVAPPPRSARP